MEDPRVGAMARQEIMQKTENDRFSFVYSLCVIPVFSLAKWSSEWNMGWCVEMRSHIYAHTPTFLFVPVQ